MLFIVLLYNLFSNYRVRRNFTFYFYFFLKIKLKIYQCLYFQRVIFWLRKINLYKLTHFALLSRQNSTLESPVCTLL